MMSVKSIFFITENSGVRLYCAVPENDHTLPMEGFLFCTPLPPGNSGVFSYIAFKNLAFKSPPPPWNFQ